MSGVTDRDVIAVMERYGGSFASHLAIAATYADDQNLARLKVAFADLWNIYRNIADREQKLGSDKPIVEES